MKGRKPIETRTLVSNPSVKNLFAYIRVSTAKQGQQGVSLAEQRDAIQRYAERHGVAIAEWFEERETAAKRGRPVFSRMIRLLRQGRASGVAIHKIDRSARNLKDWADLGELIDRGIEVHFANESLDLNSRGGRLSADIQAVVAADYIRNLREETRKGFYGRIKQGVYPLPAPLGYVDKGKGQPKELDPLKGPLVRQAFELYAGGRYGLDDLVVELHRRGLRNKRGGKVTRSGISVLLNNPFYIGFIRLRKTGETFPGSHQPLVSKALFDRTQQVLAGKTNTRVIAHDFLFRRLLKCKCCGYSLIGERQKGHVYYRCHTRDCPPTSVREEIVEVAFLRAIEPLQLADTERAHVQSRIPGLAAKWERGRAAQEQALSLRLAQVRELLGRLTDAYLDQSVEKDLFEERKTALLLERRDLEDQLAALKLDTCQVPELVAEFLELAGSACVLYETADLDERRDLIATTTSNRTAERKTLDFALSDPFSLVANRHENSNGGPYRDRPRTLDVMIGKLVAWFKSNFATSTKVAALLSIHRSRRVFGSKGEKLAG